MHGLVLVEYIHRLIAFLATVFIVYNAWRSFRKRRGDVLIRWLALLSVFLLLLQSMLGALIVVMKLPGWFTTIDVSNSLILLAVLGAMTAVGVREVRDRKHLQVVHSKETRRFEALRWPAGVTTIAIFIQTVIGGFFRHSGESQALFGQDSYLLSHFQHSMPSIDVSVVMLIVHISFTAVVVAAIVWLTFSVVKIGFHRTPVIALLALTAYQAVVGIVSLQTKLSLISDTLHFAGAAAMILISGYVWMMVLLEGHTGKITEPLATQ